MDFSSIATIILGSSVLGAVLSNLISWALEHKERSRLVNYQSLRLAHVFEQFAYWCLSAAEGHDSAEQSDGHMGGYIKTLPAFPALPDFNYKDFDLLVLDTVLDFPQRVDFANESLSYAWEVLDGEDAVKEGYKSSLAIAEESLAIADSIRTYYKLQKRSLQYGHYSVRERLNELKQGL